MCLLFSFVKQSVRSKITSALFIVTLKVILMPHLAEVAGVHLTFDLGLQDCDSKILLRKIFIFMSM